MTVAYPDEPLQLAHGATELPTLRGEPDERGGSSVQSSAAAFSMSSVLAASIEALSFEGLLIAEARLLGVVEMLATCQVPCDHIPRSSYALFRARGVCKQLIATIRAKAAETN